MRELLRDVIHHTTKITMEQFVQGLYLMGAYLPEEYVLLVDEQDNKSKQWCSDIVLSHQPDDKKPSETINLPYGNHEKELQACAEINRSTDQRRIDNLVIIDDCSYTATDICSRFLDTIVKNYQPKPVLSYEEDLETEEDDDDMEVDDSSSIVNVYVLIPFMTRRAYDYIKSYDSYEFINIILPKEKDIQFVESIEDIIPDQRQRLDIRSIMEVNLPDGYTVTCFEHKVPDYVSFPRPFLKFFENPDNKPY